MVQREVARIERLLAASRELARIDAGIETGDRPKLDLAALLPAVVEGSRLRGPGERPARADRAHGLGRGPGRPRAPDRVFENLLDNAVSFSPTGGTVRIELARRDGAAVAVISDEGPGLRPGSEALVFSRFYTERPGSAKTAGGHTGLGLALVKAIVEGYGGSVAGATAPTGGAASRSACRSPERAAFGGKMS